MNLPSIRDKAVYVSSSTYHAMRVIAELEHMSCLDELADAWLQERLAADPRNARRAALYKKAMADIGRQVREEFDEKL